MDSLFNLDFDSPRGGATAIPARFGEATKPVEAMTADEFDVAAEQVYNNVREQAFSHGLPVIIKLDGQVVKEFADGHFEFIA